VVGALMAKKTCDDRAQCHLLGLIFFCSAFFWPQFFFLWENFIIAEPAVMSPLITVALVLLVKILAVVGFFKLAMIVCSGEVNKSMISK
jgi:hypothetical protein